MAAGLRTLRALVTLAAALVSLSCSNSSSGSVASSPRLTAPTTAADSKAADLRVRLDLLLAEHVMAITKESAAAVARSAEYTGYAGLLITNGSDLTDLMRSAFGDAGATQFDQIWTAQNGYWVDYTSGLVTHNQNKSNGAGSGLLNGFVPELALFLTSMTQIPLDPTTQLLTEQVLEMRNVIDDQVAQNFVKMYADLVTVFAQTARLGDPIAAKIVQKFPDKFPGDPLNKAADLRASLNGLLQEHAYLATMITDAAAAGRGADQAAGTAALAGNADALGTLFSGLFGNAAGTQFDQIWAARDAALVAYSGADSAARQAALTGLTDTFVTQFSAFVRGSTGVAASAVSRPSLAQVKAAAQVIDDQRTKTFDRLAPDDRTAAETMQPIADLVTANTVLKLPSKFASV
jgi:hypothetical protein